MNWTDSHRKMGKENSPRYATKDGGSIYTIRSQEDYNWDYNWMATEPHRGAGASENINKHTRTLDELSILATKTVPLFGGDASPNVAYELDMYLEGCETMSESARIGEKALMTRCFKMRLNGEAYQEISLDNIETYEQLKHRLTDVYKSSQTYDECNNDLRSCMQQPGEETRLFLRRVDKLFKTASYACKSVYDAPEKQKVLQEELERAARKVVQEGLLNKVTRMHLITVQKDNLKELIQYIENL